MKEYGNELFKQQKYEEAARIYTHAISLDPQEPSYLTNRAAAYMAQKAFQAALSDCQAASLLQTTSPSARTLMRLARCHMALGNPAAAVTALQTALRLEPDNGPAREQQAAARKMLADMRATEDAMRGGDWQHAEAALERACAACEGEPLPIAWRLWRVRIALARKQYQTAEAGALEMVRADPHAPEPLALRALVLFTAGQLPEARQHAQMALRADPEHKQAGTLFRRARDVETAKEEGNTAFKAGNTRAAVERYSAALTLVGQHDEEGGGGLLRATLLANRAAAFLKNNKTNKAIRDADQSIALSPQYWKALRTRGRAKLAKYACEGAVADFRAALEAAESYVDGADAVPSLREELRKAEVALKHSKSKDYYRILGLKPTATEAEITRAFRRASTKFKLVSEAHAVLSDPARKQRYDDGEVDPLPQRNPAGRRRNDEPNDIFASFLSGMRQSSARNPPPPQGNAHEDPFRVFSTF